MSYARSMKGGADKRRAEVGKTKRHGTKQPLTLQSTRAQHRPLQSEREREKKSREDRTEKLPTWARTKGEHEARTKLRRKPTSASGQRGPSHRWQPRQERLWWWKGGNMRKRVRGAESSPLTRSRQRQQEGDQHTHHHGRCPKGGGRGRKEGEETR